MHKISRKLKRNAATDNQILISITEHFISDNPQTQRLITTQTRLRLIAVKDELLNIFTVTKETFRERTVNTTSAIDLNAITSYLLKDSVIVSIYSNLVVESRVKLVTELKHKLLENMLKLYLRVWSFSFAKDLTYEEKLKLIQKRARDCEKKIRQSFENK